MSIKFLKIEGLWISSAHITYFRELWENEKKELKLEYGIKFWIGQDEYYTVKMTLNDFMKAVE
jgi:hypothetical protein